MDLKNTIINFFQKFKIIIIILFYLVSFSLLAPENLNALIQSPTIDNFLKFLGLSRELFLFVFIYYYGLYTWNTIKKVCVHFLASIIKLLKKN